MGKLTLHGISLSPFVRKVKIALIEKGIDHEHVQTIPAQNADLKKISPLGKIPVLQDEEGRPINDSSVIINYLEERFTENSILPQDVYQRARARWFEEYADSALVSNLGAKIFFQKIIKPYAQGQPTDEAIVQEGLKEAPKFLSYLEEQLQENDYFVGNSYSLADISIASVFCNLEHADFFIEAEKYPKLAQWWQRVTKRPYYKDLATAEKAFIEQLKEKAKAG